MKDLYGSFLDDCGFTLLDNSEVNTYIYKLDPKIGNGTYKIYSVADRCLFSNYNVDFTSSIHTTIKSSDALSIGICKASRPKDSFDTALSSSSSLLAEISHKSNFNLDIKPGDYSSQFGISFTPNYYNCILKPITNLTYNKFSEMLNFINNYHDIPELELLVNSLTQLPFNSVHINTFIESKLIHIVSTILQVHERIATNSTTDFDTPKVLEEMEYVKEYIMNNYMMSLKIDQLSKLACMSRSKFLYSFKNCYNTTVTEYIKQLRISSSKELLLNTSLMLNLT